MSESRLCTLREHARRGWLAGWVLALSACGGGSGGNGMSPPPPPQPTVSLTASVASVVLGSSLDLSWSSTDADSCVASGDWEGTVALSGQQAVTPAQQGTATYTLTCSGAGGNAQQSVPVTVTAPGGGGGGEPGPQLWVTGYYPAYKAQALPVAQTPFASLTHVVHFAMVPAHAAGTGNHAETEGEVGTLADPFGVAAASAELVAAARAAGAKVLLGIGGDTSVDAPLGFQQAAAAPATRDALAEAIVAAMQAGDYDGVDVNWESVRLPQDVADVQALLQAIRNRLDALDPATHFLLTYPAATTSDFNDYSALAQMLLPVQTALDQINLQTYVMAGPYPGWVTWHNSALFAGDCFFPSTGESVPSIDATVQAFRQAGIAPQRLGIGVQVVGVDWQGGSGTDTGGVTRPCQAWDTSGTRENGQDSGAPDYSKWRFVDLADILRNYTPAQGFVEGYDDEAQAAWIGKDGLGAGGDRFVSIENAQSIADKAAYLRAQGLGGMIVFEISQDYRPEVPLADPADTDPQHPLLSVIREQVLQRE